MILDISKDQQSKLTRYLMNADPFLWGILEAKNKKGRIQELKKMGLLAANSDKSNHTYSRINQDLLLEMGIGGILERIVVTRIRALFSKEVLDYFHRCWETGQTPTVDYLRRQGLYRRRYGAREVYDGIRQEATPSGYKDPPFIFLQIHLQANFVERWTVFAGLWFEEIEPLISGLPESTQERHK